MAMAGCGHTHCTLPDDHPVHVHTADPDTCLLCDRTLIQPGVVDVTTTGPDGRLRRYVVAGRVGLLAGDAP